MIAEIPDASWGSVRLPLAIYIKWKPAQFFCPLCCELGSVGCNFMYNQLNFNILQLLIENKEAKKILRQVMHILWEHKTFIIV